MESVTHCKEGAGQGQRKGEGEGRERKRKWIRWRGPLGREPKEDGDRGEGKGEISVSLTTRYGEQD